MTIEPIDKYFGIPLSEWINRIPNELESDAVGLWQIVIAGKDNFGLSGEDLKRFVERGVATLLRNGATPVRASSRSDAFWEKQFFYGENEEDIVKNVILEWINLGRDPDQDDLWFSRLDS